MVKTVSKSIDRSGAAEVKKRLNGLDQALEVLKGPKVVSTIAKSSNDWENYKEQEGLEDDLAKAAKDGLVSCFYCCCCNSSSLLHQILDQKRFS